MEERESRGIMPISKLNQISTPKRNQAGQRTCTQHKRQAQRGAEQQSRGSAPQPMEVVKPPRELPGRPNAEAAQNMSLFTLKTYVLLRPTHLCINSKTK